MLTFRDCAILVYPFFNLLRAEENILMKQKGRKNTNHCAFQAVVSKLLLPNLSPSFYCLWNVTEVQAWCAVLRNEDLVQLKQKSMGSDWQERRRSVIHQKSMQR